MESYQTEEVFDDQKEPIQEETLDEKLRLFNGLWFPSELWLNKELAWIDKILYIEIDSFCRKGKKSYCYATTGYLASFLKVSITTVKKSLSRLEELGLITRELTQNRHRLMSNPFAPSLLPIPQTENKKELKKRVKLHLVAGRLPLGAGRLLIKEKEINSKEVINSREELILNSSASELITTDPLDQSIRKERTPLKYTPKELPLVRKRPPLVPGGCLHLFAGNKPKSKKKIYTSFDLCSNKARNVYYAWLSCKTFPKHTKDSKAVRKVMYHLDHNIFNRYSEEEVIKTIKAADWMRSEGTAKNLNGVTRYAVPKVKFFSIEDFFFVCDFLPDKFKPDIPLFESLVRRTSEDITLGTREEALVVEELIKKYRENVLSDTGAEISIGQQAKFFEAAKKLLSYMNRTNRLEKYILGKKVTTWDYVHHAFHALAVHGLQNVTPKNLASDWLWNDVLPKFLSTSYGA